MFDLIGFWAGVTIYMLPLIVYTYLILETIASSEVDKITKGKHSWGPYGKWYEKQRYSVRGDLDNCLGISMILTAILWLVTAMVWDVGRIEDEGSSFIGTIVKICEVTSPVTGTMAMIIVAWLAYVFGIRKGLTNLFELKEKVDKL